MESAITPAALLFDRDGTLIHDVPYNGDPSLVRPIDGVREALARVRAAGIKTAVVSNQSGIGRGLVTEEQVESVNRRVDDLLGPFDAWVQCPHRPEDECACRKPKPQLVADVARALGVAPAQCVMIGDNDSDVRAAEAAGARGIKVNGARTLADAVNELLRRSD
ncbi:MAG: HAD-IIIA family hydrolase [Candidatus Eremiobacteraeota bacterium]|nr:HAD-IIIA family hydrolase [Candidatus Eremiobacteraeota bacterium]